MARRSLRRNTDHYEEMAPSMVVPDHFACNQSSTIVIIYGEAVGEGEDQLTFIFPGEISGGNLKKIYPQQVDSRTFVIETPIYSILRRGFVYVSPQLRLSTGEVIEMADFKISLKHPVRNVMELCLNLSTQSAVLPVLLTLLIHSDQNGTKDVGSDQHFIKDPHFDRIMATLVGSTDPGTRNVRDIILPGKKWKKLNLMQFAREFEMQEMEKQAYQLSKRGKEKKKVEKHYVNYSPDNEDATFSEIEEDIYPPSIPLFNSHLSSSTPEINKASVLVSKDLEEPSLHTSPKRRPKKHTKTLPMVPVKKKTTLERNIWTKPRSVSEVPSGLPSDGVYDAVKFDVEDDLDNDLDVKSTGRSPVRKPFALLKLKNPIPLPTSSHSQAKGKEEDTLSLDSYEEMNEVPGLADERREWQQGRESWQNPPAPEEPPPPPPPLQRDSSRHPDPSARAKMPLPPTPPSPQGPTPAHYTLSTKQVKKNQARALPPEPTTSRALPPEPISSRALPTSHTPMRAEPTCPPPSSKLPFPEPKPAKLKKKAAVKRHVSRRRKDVYIPDSESEEESDMSPPQPAEPFPPKQPNHRDDKSQKAKKPPYVNLNVGSNAFEIADDEHMYDSAEVPEGAKKRAKKSLFVKREASSESQHTPPQQPRVKSQYQNVDQVQIDPPYDQNPTLPPRVKPPSYEDAPNLPPRFFPPPKATQDDSIHRKKAQPAKTKVGQTLSSKLPPSPKVAPKMNANSPAPPTKTNPRKVVPPPPPIKPDKSSTTNELSEQLSSIFASRNAKSQGPALQSPGALKKHPWKRGEPPGPAGGMTNFI